MFRPKGEDAETSVWDIESLKNLEEKSWIGTKTDLVAQMPMQIFGGLTFNANEKFINAVIKILTFGHKKKTIKEDKIKHYFDDIHESVMIARANKKYLKYPLYWGFVYSFFEVATYWIVAISLGRPDLLPFILVGEAIGSVFDGIVPYGLYELGMAGVMIALLGMEHFPTVTIVTVMTRVLTLILTIVTGTIPYYKVIRGKEHDDKSTEDSKS